MQKDNSLAPLRIPGAEITEQGRQPGNSVVKSGDASVRVVVFTLAGHEHCVDVRRVREIIMAPRLSTVIESPHFVDGVIEVRGKIVPVIDLRRRLQVAEAVDSHEASVVVIAQFGKDLAGFRVDSVSEILTVPTKLIEPPTRVVGGVKTSFIDGLAYVGSRFLVFLNLDAILSPEEESGLGRSSFGRTEDSDQEAAQTAVTGYKRIITFQLDKETYGAEIGEVAEIMEMVPIMPIPHVPPLVLGLVNLRGTIVPIIDLRVRFGLDRGAWTADSRIVIVKERSFLVGLAVDTMWEFLKLTEDSFQPAPHGVARIDAEYFKEVCEVKGRMVSILDIKKILEDTAVRSSASGRREIG